MEKLTFVSGISVPERCHHGLEAAVQRFRLRVKPDKGDIGPDEDGVGDTSAEILLSRGHVSAFFEHVHEVGVALVRSLQFEGIRERQLNLKVVRVSPINATSPDRRVKKLKGFSRDWTRCVSRRGERESVVITGILVTGPGFRLTGKKRYKLRDQRMRDKGCRVIEYFRLHKVFHSVYVRTCYFSLSPSLFNELVIE